MREVASWAAAVDVGYVTNTHGQNSASLWNPIKGGTVSIGARARNAWERYRGR
jgi:hypothetical protein